jgi:hypothetical protein
MYAEFRRYRLPLTVRCIATLPTRKGQAPKHKKRAVMRSFIRMEVNAEGRSSSTNGKPPPPSFFRDFHEALLNELRRSRHGVGVHLERRQTPS